MFAIILNMPSGWKWALSQHNGYLALKPIEKIENGLSKGMGVTAFKTQQEAVEYLSKVLSQSAEFAEKKDWFEIVPVTILN